MTDTTVPTIEADEHPQRGDQAYRDAEIRLLDLSANSLSLKNSEVSQRIALRWIALGLAMITLVFMGSVLIHSVHMIFGGHIDLSTSTVAAALVVGPMASITAITLAFFVGAFRRFDNKDAELMLSGVNTGVNALRN